MSKYENSGIKLQCAPEELAVGKVSVVDGFVNSTNPEKDKFLDYIAQEAAVNSAKEKALIDAIFDGWGVNGANVFNVIGFDLVANYE